MNPVSCAPSCCATPLPVNIPGTAGAAGPAGQPAYTTLTATLTIPAVGATVLATVLSSAFLVVGQAVVIGQGAVAVANPGPATFKVTQIVSGTVVNLQFLGYALDQTPGYIISIGAQLTPGGNFGTLTKATASSPANPTGTTSTGAAVMMGLAGTITPVLSGRVLVVMTGTWGSGTIGDGVNVQLSYGTGAAPANADALTGTQFGSIKHLVAATVAGRAGFTVAFFVTGLTSGTAYWLDLAVEAVTGSTATIYDVDIVAIEF